MKNIFLIIILINIQLHLLTSSEKSQNVIFFCLSSILNKVVFLGILIIKNKTPKLYLADNVDFASF